MATVAFDTHRFVRRLKDSGMPEEQAEALSIAFRDAFDESDITTRRDLHELEKSLRADMREMEYRLTIKLGSLMAASIGLVAALVKLL